MILLLILKPSLNICCSQFCDQLRVIDKLLTFILSTPEMRWKFLPRTLLPAQIIVYCQMYFSFDSIDGFLLLLEHHHVNSYTFTVLKFLKLQRLMKDK